MIVLISICAKSERKDGYRIQTQHVGVAGELIGRITIGMGDDLLLPMQSRGGWVKGEKRGVDGLYAWKAFQKKKTRQVHASHAAREAHITSSFQVSSVVNSRSGLNSFTSFPQRSGLRCLDQCST